MLDHGVTVYLGILSRFKKRCLEHFVTIRGWILEAINGRWMRLC